jgi:hypothetical protein
MKKCPKCKEEVSEPTSCCPHCSSPIQQGYGDYTGISVGVGVGVVFTDDWDYLDKELDNKDDDEW